MRQLRFATLTILSLCSRLLYSAMERHQMAVTQALKADDAAAAAAAAQARRDANTSGSEPAQGVEEIWNQKQLAKVVGTMVASSVSP